MKNVTGIFSFFVIACVLTLLTACLPNNQDDDSITAPTVYKSTSSELLTELQSYSISFAPIDKMEYANVFRTRDDGINSETVNIGQVIPIDKNSLPSAFIFEDPYTTSGGNNYVYVIRFYNGSYYSYSKASPSVPGLNSGSGEIELGATNSADPDGEHRPEILYVCNHFEGEEEYNLRLGPSTKVTLPEDFLELRVVVGPSEESRRPFALKTFANKSDADYSASIIASDSLLTDDAAQATPIDLQKLLPADYFDTNLFVPYLIGVRAIGKIRKTTNGEYIKSQSYAYYYWTKPKEVYLTVYERLNDESGTVYRGEKNTDGTYTGTAANPPTIKVPSLITPENSFDYSNRSVAGQSFSVPDDVPLDVSPYNPELFFPQTVYRQID